MENLSNGSVKKIKLNKKQQFKMLEFFLKTSIPRMLSNKHRDSSR